MWLLKTDEEMVRKTGLYHDAARMYVGGMDLLESEGQRYTVRYYNT